VKLPTWLKTLPNKSGRSQAAVKAQMPPLLIPQRALPAGSLRTLYFFSISGRISFSRKVAYWSEGVSYSKLRLLRPFSLGLEDGTVPGFKKHANGYGHFFFVYKVVKYNGGTELALLVSIAASILKYHNSSRGFAIVLCGYINQHFANSTWEDIALPLRFLNFTLGSIGVWLGIDAKNIIICCEGEATEKT